MSEFGKGAWESTAGLVEFGFKLSPTYALIDPDGYVENLTGIAKGLAYGATHPAEFAKAVTNWDMWLDNPARALGQLVPDIALALATAGAGAAAGAAARGAGGVGRVARSADELSDVQKAAVRGKDLEHARKVTSIIRQSGDLRAGRWAELSDRKRIGALQDTERQIAAIHGREPARVKAEHLLPDEAGYYDAPSHTIVCNKGCLADREETLRTLVHEGRHAYQHHAVQHADVEPRSGGWRENFEEYVDPVLDYEGYRKQSIERDAFDFEGLVEYE